LPKKAWKEFGDGLAELITAMLDSPDKHAATIAMLWYASQILTDSSPTGLVRRICARVQAVRNGQDPILYEERRQAALPRRRRQKQAKNTAKHRTAARMHFRLTMNNLSRAAGCLDPGVIIHDPSPEDIQKLQDAHPHAAPAQPPPITTAAPDITDEIVQQVLSRLSSSKAPGPSGWTYEHISAASRGSPLARKAITRLMNEIVAGRFPQIPELLSSRLCPFRKQDSGVRPIACQEAWVRIASLCASAAAPDVGPSLAPLQVGVGVKGGTQTMGHGLHAALTNDPEGVFIALDFKNAYGSIHTQSMLDAVKERAPALLPYAIWANTSPARLHVVGAPDGSAPIISSRGVKQGDPIAPLFFALTLQGPLESVVAATDPADAFVHAYADDCTLQGRGEPLRKAYRTLTERAGTVGLEVVPAKCGVYSQDDLDGAIAAAAELDLPHRPQGIVCAGTPLGSGAFLREYCQERADKTCTLIDHLLDLPLSAQDKWLVLRGSLQKRMAHLVRVLPWAFVEDAVRQVEARAVAALREIARDPEIPAWTREQLHLPLRHGGFGLADTTEAEANAALVSAAALAQQALSAAPERFQPFAGAYGVQKRMLWGELHDSVAEVSKWGPQELDDEFMSEKLHELGKKVTRAVGKARCDALLQQMADGSSEGEKASARMLSCACRGSSLFLDSLPTSRLLTLSDVEFVHGVLFRGGMPLVMLPLGCEVVCDCMKKIRAGDVDHAMCCTKNAGLWVMRHDNTVSVWRRRAGKARFATSHEPEMRKLNGAIMDDSRGDVLLIDASEGAVVLDVSFIHPAGDKVVAKAAKEVGSAAEVRENEKVAKYKERAQGGYKFVPLAHESYGRLGKQAMSYLHHLAESACGDRNKRDVSMWMAQALREFSAAGCKGNSLLIRNTMSHVAQITGTSFEPAECPGGTYAEAV